jgi:hypothetical protein
VRIASLVVLLSAVVGCGDRLATVTGTVTLDGQPLRRGPELVGTVQFVPENGGVTATAYLDENGQYTLTSGSRQGTQPGRYLIAVSATKIIPADTEGGAASGRPATPRRYADPMESGFAVEVVPGRNTFDFPLSSK